MNNFNNTFYYLQTILNLAYSLISLYLIYLMNNDLKRKDGRSNTDLQEICKYHLTKLYKKELKIIHLHLYILNQTI